MIQEFKDFIAKGNVMDMAGATVFAYGSFFTAVINFLIIAWVVFMLVKMVNRVKAAAEKPDEVAPEVDTGPSEKDLLMEIRDAPKDAIDIEMSTPVRRAFFVVSWKSSVGRFTNR